MYNKLIDLVLENVLPKLRYVAIFLIIAILIAVVAYFINQYLNPPQEVTTISQNQAETVQGVQTAAENAKIEIDDGQAKEIVTTIKEIHTTEQVPIYIVQTDGENVKKETEKAVAYHKADFAIVTSKENPDEQVNLDAIPKEAKVELNQYNVQAYKKQLNTIEYAPQEKVVEYVHQWKVSDDGHYVGAGISHDLDDNKTYIKFTYTW